MSPTDSEIIFEVSDDEVDGGYSASALGYGIHTQAETIEEIHDNIHEAVEVLSRRRNEPPESASAALRQGRSPKILRHSQPATGFR